MKILPKKHPWLIEVLVCPKCHQKLNISGAKIFCPKCHVLYKSEKGVISLLRK